MNTTALFLSAALSLFNTGQEPAATPDLLEIQEPEGSPDITGHPIGEEAIVSGQLVEDAERDGEALVAAQRAQEIARVQAWFDRVDTLQARFTQIAPDRSETAGTLMMDRPGRARFEYDEPTPILLVADGSTVAIADFQLETIDRVPLGSTPLAPLLEADQALAESGAVEEAGRFDGRLYLTLIDPNDDASGRVTLIFTDPDPTAPVASMQLNGWYAVDALGGLTEVVLSEIDTGVTFDPRLFILDDEDVLGRDDRRRGRR